MPSVSAAEALISASMPKNQRWDCTRVDDMESPGEWWGGDATIIQRRDFVNKMSPRKYDMSRRASAVAETRRRIIDATRALHTERGIAATSWDDIAARAGVGVGTVYRHFPSPDD